MHLPLFQFKKKEDSEWYVLFQDVFCAITHLSAKDGYLKGDLDSMNTSCKLWIHYESFRINQLMAIKDRVTQHTEYSSAHYVLSLTI